MAVLIYTEQQGDKLKLLAEVGEDNVELAVDALLDAEPKFASQQPFVVFPADQRMIVEVGEIVRPRRDIKINGVSANGAPTRSRTRRAAEPQAAAEPEPAAEAPAAKPAARKRVAAKKSTAKRGAGRPASKKPSPFKRNPASDE